MKQQKRTSKQYDYFVTTDTSQYTGEWIAISGQKVVAHGKKADIVYKKAQKLMPNTPISLAKAPHKHLHVLSFSA